MDVVSGGPFRVASLVWHNHVGTPVLTVAAKATFLLEQGESPLAPVQEPLNEEDNYWDEEAFAQGKRALPADHLTTHTERMLLHKRRYQKRTVFGGECIRSLLTLPGAAMEGVVVVYLPEKLGKELPMVQRMRCRVLAEVEAQQDQYEAGAVALRVVGVGRAMRT